jgi:phosphoglycerate dehydrogenase-like enzyme
VARACSALDMTVLAMKRWPSQSADEYAAEIHPVQDLDHLLPRANSLIVCLPLTPQTENVISERELALLPANALLVNVGRGPIVNEAALFNALKSRHLCAAGLDVWYSYPPDKDSRTNTPAANFPFHELDNVVMSPHRGGDTNESDRLRMVHLAKLVNAIYDNEPVPNKVDLTSGY